MNVVTHGLSVPVNCRTRTKSKQIGLIRKNTTSSILGQNAFKKVPFPLPRYQFSNVPNKTQTKNLSMGPPSGIARPIKKSTGNDKALIRSATQSASGQTESSPGVARPRVLASDSMMETSRDMHTPANRPTALRYISSSSKGYTHPHSARSTTTSIAEASVILAITEGRGKARGEIGLAAVDLRRPHLVLCQYSDSLLYLHTLTKINLFNPVEIIVPHTFCECAAPTQLYCLIRDQYPGVTLTSVQRKHFNFEMGKQQIMSLCAPAYSAVYMHILHKFYAITAAAAVLKYVENIQCVVFARASLKIEYHCSENTMLIDVATATHLELVAPLEQSAGPLCSLLGVLGPTYTAGGIRALRAAILQPPSNRNVIEDRLDCIRELIDSDEGLMSGVQEVIKKLTDVEKILFLCLESPKQEMNKMSEAQLNQVLLLKTTMDLVPKLVEALGVAQSGRLRMIKMDFENPHYKDIADCIRHVIQEDAHMEKGCFGNLQRCFAVKPDINGLLDVARRTYSELIDDIEKIVENLSETYDLPIRLNQNSLKGFHIVMPLQARVRRTFNVGDLPQIFIQVQNNGASISMTTEELVVLDQQTKESLNEIHSMSNIVIYGLLKELRPFMGSLYKLCENIAELDIMLALANASSVGAYVRPEFSEYVDIRNSVHPLLEYNSQKQPVQNDIFASPEYNFAIITGPNMGGKSIYIKQIALLHIMAQIGCFVPATHAVLRLTDRIFSRIGFNDSVELNASTYVLEMKEVQHILKDLTPTSLVIIDELCRGTCSEEGASMAWAVSEELLQRPAFTFFTTHFIYLTRLQTLYLNVTNLHTTVGEELKPDTTEKRLIYKHKIAPGVTSIDHYGLALARNTNLPEMTVKLAEELAEVIVLNRKPLNQQTPEREDEILLYKLTADINQEKRKCSNSEAAVKKLLETFRKENPGLLQRLRDADESRTEEVSAASAPTSSKSSVTPRNADPKDKESSSKTSSCENVPLQNFDNANSRKELRPVEAIRKDVSDKCKASDAMEHNIYYIGYNKSPEAAIKNQIFRNTTQQLNVIPEDYNNWHSSNESLTIAKTNNNVDASEEGFHFDEESMKALDKIESDHSMLLEKHKNSNNNDERMQISQDSLNDLSIDLESQSTQKVVRHERVLSLQSAVEEMARKFASQSTLVLEPKSQTYMDTSSSVSSFDEVLYMETVADIHNEINCLHEESVTVPEIDDINDLFILFPPPPNFAD